MGDSNAIPPPVLIANIELDQRMADAFLILVVLSVAVRMYVRLYMTKQFTLQDWVMIPTFLCTIIHIGGNIANCSISLKLVRGDLSVGYTFEVLYRLIGAAYVFSIILLKISVGCFFLYIFAHQRVHSFVVYTVMILSTIFGICYVPFGVFICDSLKAYPGEVTNCSHQMQNLATIFFILFSVVTIIGDFAFSIMGCAALWNARLQRATKISASVLLCFGTIGGVASVIRLGLFLLPGRNQAHVEYQEMLLVRWILVEVTFSVVAANLVMTKPLFQAALSKIGLIDPSGSGGSASLEGPPARRPSLGNSRMPSDPGLGGPLLLHKMKRDMRVDSHEEELDVYPSARSATHVEVV